RRSAPTVRNHPMSETISAIVAIMPKYEAAPGVSCGQNQCTPDLVTGTHRPAWIAQMTDCFFRKFVQEITPVTGIRRHPPGSTAAGFRLCPRNRGYFRTGQSDAGCAEKHSIAINRMHRDKATVGIGDVRP